MPGAVLVTGNRPLRKFDDSDLQEFTDNRERNRLLD